MAERIQKSKTTHEKSETPDTAADAVTETGEKIKADIDDLLDEIDDVLETNAEDFVKSYVQKGGQ
ncbi:MAG: ubiquitin-like protein Pup [Ilumatobacter sp.]|jgi:ubiquitin-like protein Pup|uniref:ubiquitin-like protein Pup n=1 Tax=Ilumatobacter sp. TaxID=1967498 RepID=UPI001DFF6273|nr:ubiquitin-like protein Pup [Ilumatobacter sp.]MBT5275507.1 ubiquitin-like protein Pup [Ilumatobacter sp.]MBT5553616.1 ubiquitin-like protein Pup [Ilumatobacter sp.]MBT5864652.1 ubiquitin-like protein Pup [Ilumatobacter sp.]MDC3332227.1 ubiquitin-like protein Pup [Ilumatobacter sp.]